MNHMTITTEELQNKDRLIVIGDVHGCLIELQTLLFNCEFNEERDLLIFVGDLVNKGPFSAEVIQYVRKLFQKGVARVVRGNHDDALLRKAELPLEERSEKYSYIEKLTR